MPQATAVMLLVGLLLGETPTPKPPQCTQDADCVLATRCSCDCCHPLEPMTQAANRAERQRCSRLGPCGGREQCLQSACPKGMDASSWQAVCREGRCAGERKAARRADAGSP